MTLDMGFVLAAIRTALSLATSTICNTDQGSHFTSPFYTDLLRDAHVPISIDGKARALDNLFTERLWCAVKYEEVYLKEYASPNDARRSLTGYFQFYNTKRLHQSLAYQTPAQIYFLKGDQPTDNLPLFVS